MRFIHLLKSRCCQVIFPDDLTSRSSVIVQVYQLFLLFLAVGPLRSLLGHGSFPPRFPSFSTMTLFFLSDLVLPILFGFLVSLYRM